MMRKFAVAITLLAAAGAAYAGLGSVISSFPLTGSIMAHGVAWNGTYLAVTDYHYGGSRMWRHYTPSGTLVGSFDPPNGPYSPVQFGAEFDGTYYWGADLFRQKYVYRFTTQGSTISSFAAPDPSGIAWDGTNLWIMSLYGGTVRQYTTTGSVLTSFNVAPINAGYDMAWDGTYLWCANRPTSGGPYYIFSFTTQGSVVASFASPGTFTTGCGCDGRYLWVSDNIAPRHVYQVDAELTHAVVPASLGQIKALYR
ncbi:MAG: hypothetical protein JSU81_01885 [Candidatus Coatesbacteria bacterium]|nr:MAG: hypothetical protein JSU81_01885 [Candidatus Coatesbacteria bacterium]